MGPDKETIFKVVEVCKSNYSDGLTDDDPEAQYWIGARGKSTLLKKHCLSYADLLVFMQQLGVIFASDGYNDPRELIGQLIGKEFAGHTHDAGRAIDHLVFREPILIYPNEYAKYIAKQLFDKIGQERTVAPMSFGCGPFRRLLYANYIRDNLAIWRADVNCELTRINYGQLCIKEARYDDNAEMFHLRFAFGEWRKLTMCEVRFDRLMQFTVGTSVYRSPV